MAPAPVCVITAPVAVIVSATAAASPDAVVGPSVVAIEAATAALHPASAGDHLLHERHSVVETEGLPAFVPSLPPAAFLGGLVRLARSHFLLRCHSLLGWWC